MVFLNNLGKIWAHGIEIKWENLHGITRKKVSLPTYPFERKKCWIEQAEKSTPQQSQKPLQKSPDIADWFYVPSWKRTAWPENMVNKNIAVNEHNWLIFATEKETGLVFSDYLHSKGADTSTVILGDDFELWEEGYYEINAGSSEDYVRLLKILQTKHDKPLNIIHLGCFSVNEKEGRNGTDFYQNSGFYSLLFLCQAIGELGITSSIKIGVISNQVHEVDGLEELCPEKATVLGPCGVIPKEFPNITCFNVDLHEGSPRTVLSGNILNKLVNEFFQAQAENTIAYRGNYRWVKDFQRLKINTDIINSRAKNALNENRLKQNGVYLITGGTGGIGLEIAKYLARTYRARLILTKKSGFPEKSEWNSLLKTDRDGGRQNKVIKTLIDIENSGGKVEVCQSDVANETGMKKIIEDAIRKFRSIDGVIHAAGVVRAGIIQAKDKEEIESVLSPKLQGTLNLYKLFKDTKIDFMVLFSSINSILAPYALSDYSAANSFLDAFAHYSNKKNGFKTIVINWPGWKEVGLIVNMDALPGIEAWKKDALDRAILSKDGIDSFLIALNNETTQVIVSPENFKSLIKETNETDYVEKYLIKNKNHDLIDKERGKILPSDLPSSDLEKAVAKIWTDTLGFDVIGLHENFVELGGHSLLAMQIVTKIRNAFQIEFTLRNFFERPNIAAISSAIEERLVEEIDKLSEKEAISLLANK